MRRLRMDEVGCSRPTWLPVMPNELILVEGALEWAFSSGGAGHIERNAHLRKWFREEGSEGSLHAAMASLASALAAEVVTVRKYADAYEAYITGRGPEAEYLGAAEPALSAAHRAALLRLGIRALRAAEHVVGPLRVPLPAYHDFLQHVDNAMGGFTLYFAKSYFTGGWNESAREVLGPHWTSFGALAEGEAASMGRAGALAKQAGLAGDYSQAH